MKLRLKHGECELECEGPEESVTHWQAEFHALVKDFYGVKRQAQEYAERVRVQKAANAVQTLRFAIRDFEREALA